MDQKNAFLGTEPIGRLLFRLAIPTVIAQLVNMLYNIVDRIYIGHMPQVGSLALTGLGVCADHPDRVGLRCARRLGRRAARVHQHG